MHFFLTMHFWTEQGNTESNFDIFLLMKQCYELKGKVIFETVYQRRNM